MKAIYPGSFDPFHEGHLEVLKKACKLFEVVYIVITKNIFKNTNPNLSSRRSQIEESVKGLGNCIVLENKDVLTGEFARNLGANYLIRGIRDKSDLDYEIELADANKKIFHDLETILFIADTNKREISSTRLKEINDYKYK